MNPRTKTAVYALIIAVGLGALFALILWYNYLEKQRSGQSFDSVFASYSPTTNSMTNGGVAVVRNNPHQTSLGSSEKNESLMGTPAARIKAQRITDTPVGAGSDIVGESVRYIDRAKGYIYKTNLTTGKTERISNAILPGAFAIQFVTSDTALVQTIDEAGVVVAHTVTFTKDGTATDTPLPLAILDLVTKPGSTVVYALARSNEGTALVSFTAPYDATKTPTILWSSSLTNWHLTEGPASSLLLQQKASNGIPGYAYLFDTTKKALRKIYGDAPGAITTISPTTRHVFTTTADNTTVRSVISSTNTEDTIPLSRVTIPEKCVWENDSTSLLCGFPKLVPVNEFPDIWYRGEFVFDDVLGRVDLATGTITEVITKLDTPVDMTDLKLTENGSTLVFTDKTTGALWTVKNLQ